MISRWVLGAAILALAGVSCTQRQPSNRDRTAACDPPRVENTDAERAEREGLEAYVGKDLRTLDEAAGVEFRKRVERLTGDKTENREDGSFEAWWVRSFVAGEARWIFLEAYPGYNVPDVSGLRVQLFDGHWNRLVKQTFPTGYRFFLHDVSIVRDNPLGIALIVAKATSVGPFVVQGDEKHPLFEQGDFQLQHYGLLENQFVLVRLEDDNGRLVQNKYRWSSPTKGPELPRQSADRRTRCLRSENPVEVLATLVWLSGTHLSSTEARYENVNQESVEDSTLFERVRDSPETKNALEALAESKNIWIKEYSKLARERP